MRLKFTKTVSLIIAAIFCAACGGKGGEQLQKPNPKTAFSFYYDASRDIEHGRFEAAMVKLDSAIRYKPEYATFHQVKGWVYEQMQEPDSAINAYETCLSYDSNYPEVWLRLGTLYDAAENYDASARYLRKAVQEYPDSARINLDLGRVYHYLDRPGLSLSHLKTYSRQTENPATGYWKWLGLAHFQQKNHENAVDALGHYVAAEKEDAVAWKFLGLAQFEIEQYDSSISSFNSAGNIDPQDTDLYVYRSRYFRIFKKDDIALEQLRVGLEYDSTNVNILYELAVYYYDAGDFDEAQTHIDKVIEYDPAFWRAYRYLGFLAEKNENPLLARQYYQRYLDNTYEADNEVQERIKNLQNTPPNN